MGSVKADNLITRRRLLGGVGPTIALAVLAACGQGPGADVPPISEEQELILENARSTFGADIDLSTSYLVNQTVKLGFVASPGGGRNEHYQGIVDAASLYQDAYPRLLEDRILLNEREGLTIGEVLSSLGAESRPDILIFPGSQLADLHANKLLIELDKAGGAEPLLNPQQYWGQTLVAGRVQGRQLAIPLMLGPWLMICNTAVLDPFAIDPPINSPWPREKFLTNVARMTNPSRGPTERGAFGFLQIVTASQFSDSLPPSWVWLLAMGSQLPDIEGGEEILQETPALEALELMHSLVHEQRSAIKVDSAGGRSLRYVLFEHQNAMMSYQFNSGWLNQFWRTGTGESVELAHLPRGSGHFTPVEMHMMMGVSTTASDREAAVASLRAIAQSAGKVVFPTAFRSDLGSIQSLHPRINASDIQFLGSALPTAEPVMLPRAERTVFRRNLDLPVMVDRVNPESAASSALAALSEYRLRNPSV